MGKVDGMSTLTFIPCSYADFERFRLFHYWADQAINKSARCSLVLVDGVERGFVASLVRVGKVHGSQAWLAHRTAVKLPKSHPAYFRLWAAVSDAQAQQYVGKGLRFYSVAPSDHADYRDNSPAWKRTSSDSRRKKTGYRSHEYVGNAPNAPTRLKDEPHTENVNFWVGCKRVSAACANCLMFLTQGERFKNFGHQVIHDPSIIRRVESRWKLPYQLHKRAVEQDKKVLCSVCMYSDFFIEEADAWRDDAWKVIRETPNVIYQIQTKRTERIAAHLPAGWGSGYPNVWLGASVEQKRYFYRLDHLRAIPCALRYADNVGMLEDVCPELESQLHGIGWVISGGEKGCGVVQPRAWNEQWALRVRDVCARKGIPFYFSHIQGKGQKPSRMLDGIEYNGMPEIVPDDRG